MVCYHARPSGPYVSTAFCCSVRSSRPGKSQFRNLSNELKCDEHLPRDSRNCMLNVWCMNGQLLEWKCVLWGATADFDNSHSTTICDRVSPSSSWGSRPHKAPPTPKQQRELTSASHDCSNIFFPFSFYLFLFFSLSLSFFPSLSLSSLGLLGLDGSSHIILLIKKNPRWEVGFTASKVACLSSPINVLLEKTCRHWSTNCLLRMTSPFNNQLVGKGHHKDIIRTSMISAHVVSCLHRHARWTDTRGARRMLYARAAHGRYPPQTTTPRMHGWTKMTSLFIRFIQFKILKLGLSTTDQDILVE